MATVDSIYKYLSSIPDKRTSVALSKVFGRFMPRATEPVSTGVYLDIGAVTATAAEINRVAKNSTRVGISAGATLAVTQALHDGKVINLDTAAGSVCTLPAATGSGAKFKFLVSVLATSNSHVVKVANATDFFIGTIAGVSDDPATVKGWIAANSGTVATNSDTVTLNRGTTGSVSLGEYIDVQDVAANTWSINGMITQTGTESTPFSAGV
jgi:hypothetical protein